MAAGDLTAPTVDLISEAERRLAIADQIEDGIALGPKWATIEGLPASYRSDGEYEVARLATYAVHLRESAAVYATIAAARKMPARTPRPISGPIVARRTRPVALWQAVRAEPVKAALHLLVMLLLFGGVYGYLLLLDKWVGN